MKSNGIIKQFIIKHSVGAYFCVAFAIPWIASFFVGGLKFLRGETIEIIDFAMIGLAQYVGPILAGILIAFIIDSRRGIGDMFNSMKVWRVGKWYLTVLIFPVMILTVSILLSVTVSSELAPVILIEGIMMGVAAGFLEEPGWMGFAFPRMKKRHGLIRSSISLGIIHGLWHLPLWFLMMFSDLGDFWYPFFIAFFVYLVALRVIMAWAYVNTSSLLLSQLIHVSSTGFLAVLVAHFSEPINWAISYIGYAVALWVITIVVICKIARSEASTMTNDFEPFRSARHKEMFISYYQSIEREIAVDSETKHLETSYGTTYIRISGGVNSKPLVLLHGDSENSLSMIPQIEGLSDKYRVYAIDNIYDNTMSMNSKPIKNIEDYMNWLDEVFELLGLQEGINLVAFSYGGWIASSYTVKYPKRIEKLILISSPGLLKPRPNYLIYAIPAHVLPFRFLVKAQIDYEREGLLYMGDEGKRILNALTEEQMIYKKCFAPKKFVFPSVISNDDLRSINVPMMFMIGELEKLISPQKAVERLKGLNSDITTEVIPKASHCIMWSQSVLVNESIREFIN